MSRPRYSIMPLQDKDGTWVYLFRDNDMLNDSSVACHYDGEKRNFTKTLDPIEAIKLCGDLNEQDEKLAKENRIADAIDRQMQLDGFYGNKTKPSKGFWHILGFPRG